MTTLEKQNLMKEVMSAITINGGSVVVTRNRNNIVISVDSNYEGKASFEFDPLVDGYIQQTVEALKAYLFRMKRAIEQENEINSWLKNLKF